MKVVQINATCGIGSTGKICVGISKAMTSKKIENYVLFSSKTDGYPLGIQCSNDGYIKIQALKSKLAGNYGFNSKAATKKIVNELERLKPNIVHLHNIHGHDCNLEILFTYLKNSKIKLIWTFHDCWAFTGYCTHFGIADCDKWKYGCSDCVQKKAFSYFFDKSGQLFQKKKQLFEGLDLTIVTPSQWLADMLKESFFKEYPVKVIYNGIDLSVFQPTESSFREDYGIPQSKKIVLGVAFDWGYQKGLDVFIDLAKRLDCEKYRIVLVGTDSLSDKQIPGNIISVHRMQNQTELAKLYTAADVFVNPTREEVLGLTNIEANACGTPVLTFRTGGSPECIDSTSGAVVETDDVDALEKEIIRICENKMFSSSECRSRAQKFDKNERFKEYTELYESINAE